MERNEEGQKTENRGDTKKGKKRVRAGSRKWISQESGWVRKQRRGEGVTYMSSPTRRPA